MSDHKKVFLSYRRAHSVWLARSVYQWLQKEGFDVFMDVENLDSGEFPAVILHQIEARAHFLVALTPGALERTVDKSDWLRLEIEHAIRQERNIVPVFADQFTFDSEERKLRGKAFPPKIKELSRRNGVSVPNEYFEPAMVKLRDRFLKKEVSAPIKPAPVAEKNLVERMTINAKYAAVADVNPFGLEWQWPGQKTALKPPRLERAKLGLGWRWTEVPMAMGYVLQKSEDEGFTSPVQLCDGSETAYPPPLEFSLADAFQPLWDEYYRVKAKGGFAFSDSPWSNVVKVEGRLNPPSKVSQDDAKMSSLFKTMTLTAPRLEPDGTGWKWTMVFGAFGYVLEASSNRLFANARTVYDGPDQRYSPPPPKPNPGYISPSEGLTFSYFPETEELGLTPGRTYLRVKAKGAPYLDDSPWSNVVETKTTIP